MNKEFIRGIKRNCLFLLAMGTLVVYFVTRSSTSVSAFFWSGALMFTNLGLLQVIVTLTLSQSKLSKSFIAFILVAKLLLFGIIVVVAVFYFQNEIFYFLLGLSLILPACMIELLKSQLKRHGTS
ncbi:MAG: hypothetical protein HYS98_06275 [Deltaproteobacteria bacterium]|nr:hypothetical protein [Deltaproteobacteria bacterium]